MNKRNFLAGSGTNDILRSLLGITLLENLRNTDMRKILKLDCILEDTKFYQQN